MKRMTGVLLALLLLAGCAGSGLVPLQYSAVNAARGECPGSVSIIKFEDARGVDELGRDAKDHPVMASGDVAVWVSRAVYTELGNHGCDVRYHEIDGAFSADATIKGEVLEASLTPTGNTTWKARCECASWWNGTARRSMLKRASQKWRSRCCPALPPARSCWTRRSAASWTWSCPR
ncbi:hypothetical protein [Salidesulfovibrio brasiliensis]|uniref:hypothetical protein n=1 Tax=Salidesulfovibrio brasiliensis TaxID=221711 RepID=UPI000B0FFE46|nr:hypothetical protein [Salidesulfovibrio brasiliensis]